MKIRKLGLAVMICAALCNSSVWADRGSMRAPGSGPNYGYSHYDHGGRYFWGPLGVLIGASLLYTALQPRTVYYEPRVVYAPPVYYTSQPPVVVQSYVLPGDQVVGPTYVVPQTTGVPPPPPAAALTSNAQPGPGASGAQWWYVCKQPAGYYPYIKECPTGWEKVAPTPPDAPRE